MDQATRIKETRCSEVMVDGQTDELNDNNWRLNKLNAN